MTIHLHQRSLQTIYELLQGLNTEQQTAVCEGMNSAFSQGKPTIADWFCRDVVSLEEYSNEEQPFLGEQAAQKRKPIGIQSTKTNRITFHLSQKPEIPVTDDSGAVVHRFSYHGREISPLRTAGAGVPFSGAGGADYLAFCTTDVLRTPVAGEIKVGTDQNPFYGFIQLLAYVSTLVTKNQIARANRHELFGGSIGDNPSFDFHILLADFNDRGTKGDLIKPTKSLALNFKQALQRQPIGERIGTIYCLKMDSSEFENDNPAIQLHWMV